MSLPALDLRNPIGAARLADSSLVLSAGAGSGKTFTLVSLVLGFLGRGGKAPEVLATTFGREAASDLRARILRPLDQMAGWDLETWGEALAALKAGFEAWDRCFDSTLPEARKEIALAARLWALPEGWPPWASSPESAREHWIRTRREAELLRAATVHALALELLRRRGQEAGELLEAEDPLLLRLLRAAGREILDLPPGDPDQTAARRLWAWCEGFEEGQDRWRLLAAAFDGHLDALGRWRSSTDTARYREALASRGGALLSAYAPFVQYPLEAAALNKNGSVKANFTRYGRPKLQAEPGAGASMPLLLEALERLATRFLDAKGGMATYYSEAFREAMEPLAAELPEHLEAWMTALLERVFLRFRDLKAERGLRSYGDLVRAALEALRARPEARPPALLLVDEYQDINPVQEAFLEALQARRSILVGDPKQAIYGFRGGVPELLRAKLREAAGRGEAFRLPANHRSSPPLVALSNAFVRDLVPRMDPGASDPDGEQCWEAPEPPALRVALAVVPSPKKQGGDLPAASPWIACLGREEGWGAAGFQALPGSRRRALLLPRRTGLPALRRALQASRIEPLVQGREGFWESPGVRLLMALLECVARPEARTPAMAVLRSPWVGATDGDLAAFVQGDGTGPSKIMEGLAWISELRGLSTQALVASAVARPGLLELLAATRVHGALEPARARRNLDQFLAWIPALPAVPALAWSLLKQRRAARDPGDAPAEGAAADLVIQTIHGAKGLEYDDVILPMLADRVKGVRKGTVRQRPGRPGELWMGWKLGNAAGPALREMKGEEERRAFREGLNLLYVGLTRARGRMALLQQWPLDGDGAPEAPPGALERMGDGKSVCWQHVATDLARVHADLQRLGEVPPLPARGVGEAELPLAPPQVLPSPLPPAALPEAPLSPERVRKGIQIHALLREVLVRHGGDPGRARVYLEAHPLMGTWPGAKALVEGVLGELESRGWLMLPRRTEFELAGAGRSGGPGRADLVLWEPRREAPERIRVIDFKLSAAFSEESLAQYREQLEAYADALCRTHPGAALEAWLVGLEGGAWIQVLDRGGRP